MGEERRISHHVKSCFLTNKAISMWRNTDELFLLTDDRAGGHIQTLKRRFKFKLRHVWFRHELSRLLHYIESQRLQDLLKVDPSIYLKCTRSYLWTGITGAQRVMAQLAYFDWLLKRFTPEEIRHFYASPSVCIASLTVDEKQVAMLLQPARGVGREGELMLTMRIDNQLLLKTAFTILPADMLGLPGEGHAMYVGCFQGQKNTRDLFKETTQLMERTKPNAILFNALQSIAQAWNLVGIVGASDQNHAFAGYGRTLSKRVGISYDALWKELGAVEQTPRHHWQLPLVWTPRSEQEVESKKRSALRRRNQFRQQFVDLCTEGARKW